MSVLPRGDTRESPGEIHVPDYQPTRPVPCGQLPGVQIKRREMRPEELRACRGPKGKRRNQRRPEEEAHAGEWRKDCKQMCTLKGKAGVCLKRRKLTY